MKRELLFKIIAFAMYLCGAVTFLLATTAHVWHILGIPTYICTSASLVAANIALTLALGKRYTYDAVMISQGFILGIVLIGVDFVFPLCSHMARGMFFPVVCMPILGALIYLLRFCKFFNRAPLTT